MEEIWPSVEEMRVLVVDFFEGRLKYENIYVDRTTFYWFFRFKTIPISMELNYYPNEHVSLFFSNVIDYEALPAKEEILVYLQPLVIAISEKIGNVTCCSQMGCNDSIFVVFWDKYPEDFFRIMKLIENTYFMVDRLEKPD